MGALRAWRERLRGTFSRAGRERELDEELASLVEMHVDQHLAEGHDASEARRLALIDVGGVQVTREAVRDRLGFPWVESIALDVRYAFRGLRRSSAFAVAVVLTLAVGIGANTTIASLVADVIIDALPVEHPDELVAISATDPSGFGASFSYPLYRDIADQSQVFTGVVARGGAQINLNARGVNERVRGELVTGNYYTVLGVRPSAGRLLTPADDRVPGGHDVVVLSHAFWQSRFGGDTSVIGQTVLLNERPMTVIGVTAEGFYGTDISSPADVQVPMMETPVFNPLPANRLSSRTHQWLTLFARRKPGVTLEQAAAATDVLFRQLLAAEAERLPPTTTGAARERFLSRRVRVVSAVQGAGRAQRDMKAPLLILFGVTVLVLLVMCANLANLLLARAAAREAETAMRVALGAGRGRIVQQWLVESLLLAALGAVVGAGVAVASRVALMGFFPAGLRATLQAWPDWRSFAYLGAAAIVAGLLFGVVPAWRSLADSPLAGLKRAHPGHAGGRLVSLRGALIVAQVALSLPLLVGAALFLRSLGQVHRIDSGFSADHVLVASLNPTLNGYSPERRHRFYDDLRRELSASPGVAAVGLSSESPMSGGWDATNVSIEGYTPADGEDMAPNAAIVTPGYFAALQMPLAEGRDFTDDDRLGTKPVAVVNETMARRYFGSASPIGRHLGNGDATNIEIVGVVRDAKYVDLREESRRHYYLPVAQEARLEDLTLHLRTTGDAAGAVGLVRQVVGRLDPHLPLYDVQTLEAQVAASLTRERLLTWLLGVFGALALVLAAVGLYGVVAFATARRRAELGVRLALGAPRAHILGTVVRETAMWVGTGLALGVAGALAMGRVVAGVLYGVTPGDPAAVALASLSLVAAATVAAYVPAHRAANLDPLEALRCE